MALRRAAELRVRRYRTLPCGKTRIVDRGTAAMIPATRLPSNLETPMTSLESSSSTGGIQSTAPLSSRPRIEPSATVGIAVAIGYTFVFYGLMIALGPSYSDLVKTAGGVWKGAVIPLAAGSIYLIAVLAFLRWDGVFRDPRRFSMTRLMWAPPILMAVAALIRLPAIPFADLPGDQVLAIICAGILVGFAEETMFRGILLRALRTAGRPEARVIVISSGLFGLFHLSNWAAGAPLGGTLIQVVIASCSGAILYMARRGTGLLIAGMALHGFWDASTFLAGARDGVNGPLIVIPMVLLVVAAVIVLIAVRRLWRSSGGAHHTPATGIPAVP